MPSGSVGMAGQCAIWYEHWDRTTASTTRSGRRANASAINYIIYRFAAHAVLNLRGRWASALADTGKAAGWRARRPARC